MAKRNSVFSNSELDLEPVFIPVRLCKQVRMKVTGSVTGTEYFFDGAGSVQYVDEQDVQNLLERPTHNSCCGGTSSPYFEVVR